MAATDSQDRARRLKAALRENLGRRKAQQRASAARPAEPEERSPEPGDGGPDAKTRTG